MEFCYDCCKAYSNITKHYKTKKHRNNHITNNIPYDVYCFVHNIFLEHDMYEKGWDFRFVVDKNSLGYTQHYYKRISISYYIIHDKKKLHETLLHELAHALVGPGHNHSKVWFNKYKSLGGIGGIYGHMNIDHKEFKYNLVCEDGCCLHRSRMSNKKLLSIFIKELSCVKHGKKLRLITNF
jgi:Holliday junction resolvasome RuvABC DNA-binding subunit